MPVKNKIFHHKKYDLLIWLIAVLILFGIAYNLFLKEYLLEIISLRDDIVDINYYTAIFSNLEISVTLTILVLCLIIVYKSKVINYFLELSEKKLLLLIVFINIIIQLSIALFIETEFIADSYYYYEHAKRLFSSGEYSNQYGNTTAFWPVGLPVIISIFFFVSSEPTLFIRILNILIQVLMIYTLYKIFRSNLSKKQLILFLILFTFYPNNLFNVNVLLTDFLFTALLWIVLFFISTGKYLSNYRLVVLGIIISIMTYLRPVGLVLLAVLLVLFFLIKIEKPIKSILIISFTMVILLSPWIMRNYSVFGDFIPVATNGGFNFLMGNHAGSNGGVNFDFEYDIKNPDEPAEETLAYEKALSEIIENPLESILRIPRKIFHSYKRGDSSITWSLKKTGNEIHPILISTLFFTTNFYFFVIIILSIYSILTKKLHGIAKSLKSIMAIVYLFFLALIIIYVGGERYIIPILPFHFYLASKNL